MPTLLHRLSNWAQATPDAPAQKYKRDGIWQSISARDFNDRVYHLALFLESRGVTTADAGALLSYNCPQWVHMELAMLLVGGKSGGMYPNSTSKDIHYILNHLEASVLSVQNREYFEKIAGEKGDQSLPARVKLVIVFDGDTSISPNAVAYVDALAEGRKLAARAGARSHADYLSQIDPLAGAFLIYTSGTTGSPKGALLSHDNLAFTSDLASRYWNLPFNRGSLFSFLPLCHIAEKLQNLGVGITQRYCVSFCTKFENVSVELLEGEPTLLLCVPRLWEKMMDGVMAKVRNGKGAKKIMAEWALAVGARVAAAKFSGKMVNPLDWAQLKLADKLVLSKIRAALGLRRAELLASGAAALPAHVSKWFRSLQLEILEDFGQTESTGVICMTERGVECAGTVGKPVPGIEFKLAEDGEILTRGRHVFVGYFKDPVSTESTLIDGWLHTGDLGEFNQQGMLKIRGRKKEIMKTSGGKMIAPLPIEEKLKAAQVVSQVCLVGDGRKYISALVTLTESTLADLKVSNSRALEGDQMNDAIMLAEVKKAFDSVNAELASFEQVKRFAVLTREFSVIDGEMTPTLKMKRSVIEQRFEQIIDSMYVGGRE